MNKNFLLALTLIVSVTVFGQKKISLEDAVLQQKGKFQADKLSGFQWIPNSDTYIYLEDSERKLMTASATDIKATELVSLTEVNKALNSNFRSFSKIQWKNADTFILNNGIKFYEYNVRSKTGKLVSQLSATAENPEYDKAKQNIAFTDKNNLYILKNGQTVTVTNESNEDIVSGQFIARNEFGIKKGTFWSPKSNLLAFYQKDQSEVADYPLLDITTTPGTLQNIKYPMAGQKSEKPKVGIYNLATQKTVYISPRGKSDDYLTNLSWTPDEKYVLIAELNRNQDDMHLNLYDANTGAFVRTIIEEKSNTWVEPEHDAYFPSNSNNFVWISEKDGFDNLYYYSIDGKLIKQLTQNKFITKEIIGTNPAGTEIVFYATGSNPMNMLAYKVDLNGKQTLLTKNEGQHSFAISNAAKWMFDEYSNRNTPSKSLLLDKNGKTTVIRESANKYDGYTIGSTEIKTIKAADGTTDLYTRLIKPSNFDPSKKYPVMVYVYGGPHVQQVTNSYLEGGNLWMHWMAEQGYLVFTVDSRGSANRGVAFESAIHRKVGTNEIEDQMKGVDYLKSLPYVDANRLALHGWSYGGFLTTSIMLRKPDVFKVAVAGGPVTDWKYYEIMYGERYMDQPEQNPKGYDEASTLNYVKNLKGKLLLIHGTSDDVVVEQQNLALVKNFVEAGKQVDFFPYPMHKHNVLGKDRVHLMQKVLDYIIEHNTGAEKDQDSGN
jgi:dipeptidyl-peptidase-4